MSSRSPPLGSQAFTACRLRRHDPALRDRLRRDDARRDPPDVRSASLLIETDRLILRPPIEADIEPWGAMLADPAAMRFIGGPQHRSRRWLQLAMITLWQPDGAGLFSVVEKSTNRWIGRIGPRQAAAGLGREIAWSLAPAAWGRGYASEGAAAAIDWVIASLGWSDFVHVIHPDNLASIAVARRLGSSDHGPRELPASVQVWGQTAEQWQEASLKKEGKTSA